VLCNAYQYVQFVPTTYETWERFTVSGKSKRDGILKAKITTYIEYIKMIP
jgi:hypothetical protein